MRSTAPNTHPQHSTEPMGDLNTTPLIDVMLVLLIMFIITIPVATHNTEIAMPVPATQPTIPPPDLVKNKIVIEANDQILWNGNPITQDQMQLALSQTLLLPVEPELQFEPSAAASYEAAARALKIIKTSGVTKFGFVGNEKYRNLTSSTET